MGAPRLLVVLALVLFLVPATAAALEEKRVTVTTRAVSVFAPAVGVAPDGSSVGIAAVLTVRAESPGRGDVFVRVEPLAEVDMQGSARLAVQAAGEITGRSTRAWDFYYTMTTKGPIIGGPSAGGVMAATAAAILMNWSLDPRVAMTGMINPDLSIGLVGGILFKAEAVARAGVKTFLIPAGEGVQYVARRVQSADGSVTQTQEEVDVATYANKEWGLEVREVEDLYDALPWFAGFALERPATSVDPTRAGTYLALMSELSRAQSANATTQHDLARSALEARAEEMQAGDRSAASEYLSFSDAALARARNATDAQRYYQAASFAFQSLVQSRAAMALLDYYTPEHEGETAAAYSSAFLVNVGGVIEGVSGRATNPYPWTPSELGAQAALELRLAEAERSLADAQAAHAAGQLFDAIEKAAFARERAGSAAWWAELRDRIAVLAPGANVTEEGLVALAREYAQNAALMVSYADRVLQQIGLGITELAEAKAALERAGTALAEDRIASALFGSVASMSLVNVAMTTLNPPEALERRVETLRQRAAYDLQVLRSNGIEPVYAASLFEFSEHLEASNPLDAYDALGNARMAARVNLVAAGYTPPAAEFSPFERPSPYTEAQRVLQGTAWGWLALVGLPSLAALSLAGLLSAAPIGRAKR